MSFAHCIDNDSSLFDFDPNEPLSVLEDSIPENRRPFIFASSPSTTALPNCCFLKDGHIMDTLQSTASTKGKTIASEGGTEPMTIPVAANVESELDVFSLSFQTAGSSSQPSYGRLSSFDYQVAGAINYVDSDGIMEVPVCREPDGVDDTHVGKGKGRELPPTLPPLSFSPESFSHGSVDWPSLAGPSSYGSGYLSMESAGPSPTSPSRTVEVPMNTPVTPDMTEPVTPDLPRRRTVSNASKTSRRSLSAPSIPRMKVKFTSNKAPRMFARKLLFKKSPASSPRATPTDLQANTIDTTIPTDFGYIPPGNCLTPWSRSPLATPVVETNSVWGVVASQPINILTANSPPLRTKGRSYSSPLPLPQPSVFDIVALDPIDFFEPLPTVLPAYFDEWLPHELKLHVLAALLDLHEADFDRRVKDGKWTALKAASPRQKWTGRDKGYRELFKLSRVSHTWRNLAFDGQLWSNLDLRAFPKVPPDVLVRLSQLSGCFIRQLDLTGHAALAASTLIDMSHNLSVHAALPGDLSNTTHNQLTSLNLQGCSTLTTRSLHHVLIRSPWLQRLCLKGQFAVTNTTCEVLANYCPRLLSLDLSRCPNMTGEGIRSATSCAIARGEHVQLRQLRLSGLKKVTDGMMLTLGKAAPLLEVLDLSYARDLHNSSLEAFISCTEEDAQVIEAVQLTAREAGRDAGSSERYWRRVTRLRHLNLSSCLLLTDHACSHLAHAVPQLELLELAGIGSELHDGGLVRLLNTTPNIRRLDLEDATAVSDDVLVALTPLNTTLPPSRMPRNAPPEPGHALEHLIISYANVESEALSELVRACTRLRILEADNTRLTGVALKEFVQTARRRKIADAKIVAVDCRSVGEFAVKEMTAHSRPRMGWRSWHARKLGYLDGKDEEGLSVGQDECDPSRVVIKTFYSWQTVDAVQAAREKKRKSSTRRRGNGTASSACSDEAGMSTPGRARWWSPNSRRSTGPSTPTLLDLNTDRGEGCTIM